MDNSILSSIAGKINQEQMIDIKQMTEQQNESIAALKEEIATKQAVGVQSVEIPLKDSNHGCVELPEGVYGGFATVKWRVIDKKDFENFENNDYTKYFDYDIIKNNLVFRFRKTGDRCRIDKYGHEKRLKQELIDRKIPVSMRDTVLLLASDQKVYWAVGVRRFEEFYVTDKTDRILEISVS